jgi:hypothetical protein
MKGKAPKERAHLDEILLIQSIFCRKRKTSTAQDYIFTITIGDSVQHFFSLDPLGQTER